MCYMSLLKLDSCHYRAESRSTLIYNTNKECSDASESTTSHALLVANTSN